MKEEIKKAVLEMVQDGELDIELYHDSGFYYPDENKVRLVARVEDETASSCGVDTSDIVRNI